MKPGKITLQTIRTNNRKKRRVLSVDIIFLKEENAYIWSGDNVVSSLLG